MHFTSVKSCLQSCIPVQNEGAEYFDREWWALNDKLQWKFNEFQNIIKPQLKNRLKVVDENPRRIHFSTNFFA